MKPSHSRGPDVDFETLQQKYGNRYFMIQEASKRAYELRRGHESKITDHKDPFNSGAVTALLEMQR